MNINRGSITYIVKKRDEQSSYRERVSQIKSLFNSCVRIKKYTHQAIKLKKTLLVCHSTVTYVDQYIPIIPSLSFKNVISSIPFIILLLILLYFCVKLSKNKEP